MDASKPVARRLGPFLDQARLFARDAAPTFRDLSRTIAARGPRNDLIELINSFPPLARVAMDEPARERGERRGAFPETTDALKAAAPTIAFGRPYTPDFVGWMDDFSTTGGYDALGGFSRAWINLSEILYGAGPKLHQYRRCPGANEEPAADGSNVFSGERGGARSTATRARGRWARDPARRWPCSRSCCVAGGGRAGARRERATTAAASKTYELLFDNAFGLTEGGDFKVAGVRAGKTSEFKIARSTAGRSRSWRPRSQSPGSPTCAATPAARSARSR